MTEYRALLSLAGRSLWNRRVVAGLTVAAIALSVALLLGVEKLRRDARLAFANTISGTDLIVGARSGATQLLLYSVFRIGNATNNISWESYEHISKMRRVAWAVPISLGDSHRGFRVVGTTRAYFDRYRYADKQSLAFRAGVPFDGILDAVLGAEVAKALDYQLGQSIVLAHGVGDVNLVQHDDQPFKVVGILAPTGTPVDRSVHVSLQGIEAIHVGWEGGRPQPGLAALEALTRNPDLQPKSITAMLVGLESKLALFALQRRINKYREEPLLAILPGVALQELWDLLGVAENLLRVVSVFVVFTGLIGMLTVILSSLEARRREMAVLRAVGARAGHIFALFMSEAGALALLGVAAGIALLYVGLALARPLIASELGLHLPPTHLESENLTLLAAIAASGFAAGAIPAFRAYRFSLADGLTPRV